MSPIGVYVQHIAIKYGRPASWFDVRRIIICNLEWTYVIMGSSQLQFRRQLSQTHFWRYGYDRESASVLVVADQGGKSDKTARVTTQVTFVGVAGWTDNPASTTVIYRPRASESVALMGTNLMPTWVYLSHEFLLLGYDNSGISRLVMMIILWNKAPDIYFCRWSFHWKANIINRYFIASSS